MQKAYVRIVWQNLPSRATALEADNLNAESAALDEIDDRVVMFDTTKANQVDMLQTISNVTFDRSTGVLTFVRYNGTTFDVDTDLEKIAVNFEYDPATQQLILTLIDGTKQYIDLSALITQYEFVDSAYIHFIVDTQGVVSANIIDGSITERKLEPNFLANCRLEVQKSETFANESEAWATGEKDGVPVPTTDPAYENNAKYYSIHAREEAEAWAVGERSGVPVPSTDETYHNNSKYYSEFSDMRALDAEDWAVGQRGGIDVPDTDECYHNNSKYYSDQSNMHADSAQQSKDDAAAILNQINEKIQASVFTVNFLTGNLEYTNEASYLFGINENTGNLEWEVVA